MSKPTKIRSKSEVVEVEAPRHYSVAQSLPRNPKKTAIAHSKPRVEKKSQSISNNSSKIHKLKSFRAILSSVNEFGISHMDRKTKKANEMSKIVALGGNAPKNQKMPFPLLQKIRAKKKKKEEAKIKYEAQAGIVSGVNLSMKFTGQQHSRYKGYGKVSSKAGKREKNVDFGPPPSNGRVNDGGIMKLNKVNV
mmetsp:Transcript_2657/g.3972  ORF Transcript_2657/g.3972 Transcript_2657/m.3972 type:complete len:193 (+) Transcript_2657:21-599(+)